METSQIGRVFTGCDNKETEGDGVEEVAGHDLIGTPSENFADL